MARDYGKVTNTFWTEWVPKFRRLGLGAEEIVIALNLKTGATANWLGLYYLAMPLMAHDAGFGNDVDAAADALRRLCESGYCRWDEESEMVFIPHMAAEEIAETVKPWDVASKKGDKRHPRILKDLHAARHCPFAKDFCDLYAVAFSLPTDLINEISRIHGSPLQAPCKPLRRDYSSENTRTYGSPLQAPCKPLASPLEGASNQVGSPFVVKNVAVSPLEGASNQVSNPIEAIAAAAAKQEHRQEQQQHKTFAAAACAAPQEEKCAAAAGTGAVPDDREVAVVDVASLRETITALTEIGMPPSAKLYAQADPILARLVLSHCRHRFVAPHLKPIGNRAGYIRDCLADPAKFGFLHEGDRWVEPLDENQVKAQRNRMRAEQAARDRESEREADREKREKEVAIETQRLRRWDGVAEAMKKKIRVLVRAKGGLFVGRDEEAYLFKFECIAVYERLEGEGKLP